MCGMAPMLSPASTATLRGAKTCVNIADFATLRLASRSVLEDCSLESIASNDTAVFEAI
jgi:hypothetical protein